MISVRKIILLFIYTSFFTSCSIKTVESLLSPADNYENQKSVTIAIAELPSTASLVNSYEKSRPAKPTLAQFSNKFTIQDAKEQDAADKALDKTLGEKKYYINKEKLYRNMTEEEKNVQRKKLYEEAVKKWEKGPVNYANGVLEDIKSGIDKLSNAKGIRIVDRTKTEAIIAEHNFQLNSLFSSNKNLAEVGKALNAQYLVFVTTEVSGKSWKKSDILFDFVNVSTFQKISVEYEYDFPKKTFIDTLITQAYIDTSKTYLTDALNGRWLCNGIMTNGIKYDNYSNEYFTPFSSGYKLEKVEKVPAAFDYQLDNKKLFISDNYGTIQIGKDEEIECEISYMPQDSHFWGPDTRSIWDKDKEIENYTVVYNPDDWFGRYNVKRKLSNYYVGEITIIPDSSYSTITGKVYIYKNTLAIHLGSLKKNKNGPHAFLVFTKIK